MNISNFGKCLCLLVGLAIPLFVNPTKTLAAQTAKAINDQALVYREANFDSPVIGYLKEGESYSVSSRKFNTAFHRIRLTQGVLGYVADTDLSTGQGKPTAKEAFEPEAPQKKQTSERPRFMRERTLLGVVGGMVQYSEIFAKREYRSDTTFVGLKLTTPLGVVDGPFLFDLQVTTSLAVPKFFKEFSTTTPTGNVFLGHLMVLYPLYEFSGRRGLMYLGAGPAIAYSSVLVEYQASKLILDEVRAGAVLTTGLAFDLGNSKVVFKIEPKYYVEKSNYAALEGVLQYGF